MLEKHRQELIKEVLAKKQFASVKSLTQQLQVSEATIRRDINKLSETGVVKKIQGGAESIERPLNKKILDIPSTFESKDSKSSVKKQIAKKAAQLCKNGDSLIINGSHSTYLMAEYLTDLNLNIMTNSLVLANYLNANSESRISLPSGEIYREQGILLSSYEDDGSEYYHGSMMFMGVLGIGKYGLMESDPLLIRSEQKLKKRTEKLIVLADSSKIGKHCKYILCPLAEVDILITDSAITNEYIQFFESFEIEVLIADTPNT
ncbi:DeoR/GlpR family DNA-binding transcription regulator [Aliiglaciecola sp. SL4]|uniref:DeoR/GlpR family DNA-binding transcription regulator n=1 Tax=Aliiglaciecola sp. SL4 TaxID=3239806 RepID=UPI00355AF92B